MVVVQEEEQVIDLTALFNKVIRSFPRVTDGSTTPVFDGRSGLPRD